MKKLTDGTTSLGLGFGLLVSVSMLLTGCSTFVRSLGSDGMVVEVESASTVSMDEGTERESEILYQYVTGELAYLNEDFNTALTRLSKASDLTEDVVPPLHEKLAELYVRSGALDKALLESERLLKSDKENISYRMLHASILEANGRFDEAATYYRSILEEDPERTDVIILLANIYTREGKLQEAAKLLKDSERRGLADVLILFNLGRVSELQQDKKAALSYYRKAFDHEKRSPLVIGDILRVQIELGQYKEAEEFCKHVIDLQPENALARKVLSHLLLGDKKIDEALQQFEALESLDQEMADETRLKIALIYMDKQNYKEAIRQLLLILSEKPDHDEARFYLASIYAGSNRVKEALSELEKIQTDQKMYIKSLVFSAFLWRQEGDPNKAEEIILRAYKAAPDNARVIYYATVILKDNHKLEHAQSILEEALALYPENEKFRFHYSVLLFERGKIEESLEQMELVLAIKPDHAEALNFIAYTLAEQNRDIKKAKQYVERALKIEPNNPYYLDTLGWIYFQSGNFTKAEELIKQSVLQIGADTVVLEHYADVLLALDRTVEALEYYKKALDHGSQDPIPTEVKVLERIRKKIETLQPKESTNAHSTEINTL